MLCKPAQSIDQIFLQWLFQSIVLSKLAISVFNILSLMSIEFDNSNVPSFASAHCCHSIVFVGKYKGRHRKSNQFTLTPVSFLARLMRLRSWFWLRCPVEAIEAACRANPRIRWPWAVYGKPSEAWFASIRSGLLIQISTLEHVGRQYRVVLRQETSLAKFCILQRSS